MRLAPTSPDSPAVAVAPELTREEARQGRVAARTDWFRYSVLALIALTVITRLPFMTRTLYAFDSANYALAVRDFYNVAFHQPHPPGYPLYVFFARVIDVFVHDANRALILEELAWSVLAVVATGMMGRALYGRALG